MHPQPSDSWSLPPDSNRDVTRTLRSERSAYAIPPGREHSESWHTGRDSNPQRAALETAALPVRSESRCLLHPSLEETSTLDAHHLLQGVDDHCFDAHGHSPVLKIKLWCRRPDSNRHRLRDQLLGLACLPVPPRRQTLRRWCPLSESNRRPAAYKAAALPAELNGREGRLVYGPVAVASAARCPSNWCGRWDSNPWPRRWRRRVLPD